MVVPRRSLEDAGVLGVSGSGRLAPLQVARECSCSGLARGPRATERAWRLPRPAESGGTVVRCAVRDPGTDAGADAGIERRLTERHAAATVAQRTRRREVALGAVDLLHEPA